MSEISFFGLKPNWLCLKIWVKTPKSIQVPWISYYGFPIQIAMFDYLDPAPFRGETNDDWPAEAPLHATSHFGGQQQGHG